MVARQWLALRFLSELGKMPNLYAILSKWGSVPRELSLAEVFQLGYYWETKILLTAVKLDVFSLLDGQDAARRNSLNSLVPTHVPWNCS